MTNRSWCFTLNNPNGQLEPDEWPDLKYLIWQEESAPDTGTRHYQGYAEFSKPKRLAAVRRILPHGHWEPRRGTRDQARDYCRKQERVDGPWEFGQFDRGGQGKRSDLQPVADAILNGGAIRDIAREFPVQYIKFGRGLNALRNCLSDRQRRPHLKVYFLVGAPGTGKSRYVHDMWGDDLYVLAQQSPLWFDGYAGERTLLIDEYDPDFKREWFLKVLDIYPVLVPVKGGFVYANWTKIYITANFNYYENVWDAAVKRRIHYVDEI